MATVVSIPLVTLSGGQRVQVGFGGATGNPAAIPDTAQTVRISIDRTAGASPLNSLLATSGLSMVAQVSTDGGATWSRQLKFETVGGIVKDKAGATIVTSFLGPDTLPAGAGRLVRGQVDVSGPANISLAGSITLGP